MKEITYNGVTIRHDRVYSFTELKKIFNVNYTTIKNWCNRYDVAAQRGKVWGSDVINKLIPKGHPDLQ